MGGATLLLLFSGGPGSSPPPAHALVTAFRSTGAPARPDGRPAPSRSTGVGK